MQCECVYCTNIWSKEAKVANNKFQIRSANSLLTKPYFIDNVATKPMNPTTCTPIFVILNYIYCSHACSFIWKFPIYVPSRVFLFRSLFFFHSFNFIELIALFDVGQLYIYSNHFPVRFITISIFPKHFYVMEQYWMISTMLEAAWSIQNWR